MDDINKMILKNPMFIQALKDFKAMGFIEIKENRGIKTCRILL